MSVMSWRSTFFILVSVLASVSIPVLYCDDKYLLIKRSSGAQEPLCFLNIPGDSFFVRSRLECSAMCAQVSSGSPCLSFNYRAKNRTCDVYSIIPTCYTVNQDCGNYQVGLASRSFEKIVLLGYDPKIWVLLFAKIICENLEYNLYPSFSCFHDDFEVLSGEWIWWA